MRVFDAHLAGGLALLLVALAALAFGDVQFGATTTTAIAIVAVVATRVRRSRRLLGRSRRGGWHDRSHGLRVLTQQACSFGGARNVFLRTATSRFGVHLGAVDRIGLEPLLFFLALALDFFGSRALTLEFGFLFLALGFFLQARSFGFGSRLGLGLFEFDASTLGRFGLQRQSFFIEHGGFFSSLSESVGRNRVGFFELRLHERALLAHFDADRLGRRTARSTETQLGGFLALERDRTAIGRSRSGRRYRRARLGTQIVEQ